MSSDEEQPDEEEEEASSDEAYDDDDEDDEAEQGSETCPSLTSSDAPPSPCPAPSPSPSFQFPVPLAPPRKRLTFAEREGELINRVMRRLRSYESWQVCDAAHNKLLLCGRHVFRVLPRLVSIFRNTLSPWKTSHELTPPAKD